MSDKFYDLIDTDKIDEKLKPIAELISWSLNEDRYTTFQLFLDIIGYSGEHYGEEIHGFEKGNSLERGYLEASYLADALECYSTSPEAVYDYIAKVMEADD